MFLLVVDNKEVELPVDARISLRISNPAFDPELINRIFSLSIPANLTPRNVDIFGPLDRLDLSGRKRKFKAQLIIGNLVQIDGVVRANRATSFSLTRNNSIDIDFQSNGIDFFERMEDVLWEKILPSIPATLSPPDRYDIFTTNRGNGAIYHININGVDFIEEMVPGQPIGSHIIALVDQINATFPGIAEHVPNGISPYYGGFQWDWLKIYTNVLPETNVEVYEDLRLTYIGDDPVTKTIQAHEYIHDVIVQGREEFAMPMLYNADFFGESNTLRVPGVFSSGDGNQYWINLLETPWTGVINPHYDGNTYFPYPEISVSGSGENAKKLPKRMTHTFVPFLRLKYLFKKALQASGYFDQIQGDFWTTNAIFDQDEGKMLLYNNRSIEKLEEITEDIEVGGNNYFERFFWYLQDTINLYEHLQFDNAKELWLAFLRFFQAYVEVEGDTVSIRQLKEQFTEEPYDFTDMIEDDVNIISEEFDGYILKSEDDPTDFTSKEFKPSQISASEKELVIETEFGTLPTRLIDVEFTNYNWPVVFNYTLHSATLLLPFIHQYGMSPEFQTGGSESSPRFLIDHGVQLDDEGKGYRFASSHNINQLGNQVEDYSLLWDGEDGMYEKWWTGIPDLLTGRELQINARLSLKIINEILQWKKSAVTIRSPKGQIKGYIKEIQLDITRTSIAPARVTLSIPTSS